MAGERFGFLRFGASAESECAALWRHDIDFSPQRALALARIERDQEVTATYFVQISSRYYSPFEPETAAVLREIVSYGHDIGLHFDAEVVAHHRTPDYSRRLKFEASILAEVVETRVDSFSLHNPTTIPGLQFAQTEAGLINASHPCFQQDFVYCSDSNGTWRHRSLSEVVADPTVRRLYALTHPEWWQDSFMSPRDRIQRCIDGRARRAGRYYDELLERYGRPNLGQQT